MSHDHHRERVDTAQALLARGIGECLVRIEFAPPVPHLQILRIERRECELRSMKLMARKTLACHFHRRQARHDFRLQSDKTETLVLDAKRLDHIAGTKDPFEKGGLDDVNAARERFVR